MPNLNTKVNLIFQFATTPSDNAIATVRTGGFSEGFWMPGTVSPGEATLQTWVQTRALLLPNSCSIKAIRCGIYDLQGDKLIPQGSASAAVNSPGQLRFTINDAQAALLVSWNATNVSNTSRTMLRCWPDELAIGGEVANPAGVFAIYWSQYRQFIVGNNFGFIGRDQNAPSGKIQTLTAGVVVLDALPAQMQVGSVVRFKKCYDNNGLPVKGKYIISAINATNKSVTLANPPTQTVVLPSGQLRIDQLAYFDISAGTFDRLVSRKVGRPLFGYRGRRSKSRL